MSRRRMLFRGIYPGDTVGPYGSQFHDHPDLLRRAAAQPAAQFLPCRAGFHDERRPPSSLCRTASTVVKSSPSTPVPRYITSGRDLGTFTRQDVLYQAYFVGRASSSAGMRAPLNPGKPVCRLDETERLRHLRRTRHRGHPRPPPLALALEQRLVSEMVDPPPPSSGIRRRHCCARS